MLQDAHLHIQEIKTQSLIEQFMYETKIAGLSRFINCSTEPLDWSIVRTLADRNQEIVPCFGIHPWFIEAANEDVFLQLEKYLSQPDALVGEIGLDKSRKGIDYEQQKYVFKRQLMLAKNFNKPFVVHCVRAWNDTLNLIQLHAAGVKFLMHSFNGSTEVAQQIIKMGGFLSFSVKEITKPNTFLRGIIDDLPGDRILLETDFPFQVKLINSSSYSSTLKEGYETAAAWRNIAVENLMRMVYNNGTVFADKTIDR